MIKEPDSSEIEGYLSIAEAARRLNVSHTVVSKYIEEERLNILKVANLTLVSEESVRNFRQKTATGRPRTKTPIWRESPSDALFFITEITVHIYAGQQRALMERLREMKQQKQHLFPGTIARYVSEIDQSPGTIEIQLIWKQNEMPSKAEYDKEIEALKEMFLDVLEWDNAQYSTKTVLLHT